MDKNKIISYLLLAVLLLLSLLTWVMFYYNYKTINAESQLELNYKSAKSKAYADKVTTMNSSSSDIVYFVYSNNNGAQTQRLSMNAYTMSLNNTNSKKQIYEVIGQGEPGLEYPARNYKLIGNKIYFIENGKKLSFINPVDLKVNQVNLGLKDNQNISDYFVSGDNIYYLVGEACNYYGGNCNNSLNIYNTKDNTTEEVIGSLEYNRIETLTKDNSNIYVSYSIGDAGCGNYRYSLIDTLNKKTLKTKAYDYCDGEGQEKYDLMINGMKEIRDLQSNFINTKYLRLENGNFVFTPEDSNIINMIMPKDDNIVSSTVEIISAISN